MDGKNKFWKGVLVGALVTAFAGLIVIGMAAGIWVVGKGVMGNQTVGISGGRATPSEVSLDIDRISQKMELIQGIISENYLFEEDPEMVEDGIFMGMMAGLGDPYSTYYTEEDFQELMENSIEGEYCGITNVGYKPTVGGETRKGVETYLFDYSGNLYGRFLKVEFLEFRRPERKFGSLDELKSQILSDVHWGKNVLINQKSKT